MTNFEEWWNIIRPTLPEKRIERCKPIAKMAWIAAQEAITPSRQDLHLWSDEHVAELKRKGIIVETHEFQSDDDKDDIPW
jgi:hypothetical protein